MTSIVALDIETTGLDPQTDAIIEIGALRFNGKRIEDEWSSLINPNRHIPEFITNLTSITDEMVRQAPCLKDVLEELSSFFGDLPILGHNLKFDLSFLKKSGLLNLNERIDTYELASVLLPSASRYNLSALGNELAIPLAATHRALDDARITHAIYQKLIEQAHQLPINLIKEIVKLSEPLDWDGAWAFRHVLQLISLKNRQTINNEVKQIYRSFNKVTVAEQQSPPLVIPEIIISINPDEVASILEEGSPFSKYFEKYEYRPEQVEMLRAVSNALSNGHHLIVEAGTGVGKSFAYLVPTAIFTKQNNTRVVISTNTINLQDQLIKKDVPDLQAALGWNLHASVLKGRSNYLCPRRFELFRQRGPSNADELRILAKVMVWLIGNSSGDRAEINLTGPVEKDIWQQISAEDDACTTETCLERTGGACPFFRARQKAQNAHILIVNHALLLTDAAVSNRILPDYEHIIVDEGHHLEAAITNALSVHLTNNDVERLVREIGGSKSGILGYLLSTIRNQTRPSNYATLNNKIKRATDLAWRLDNQMRIFFTALGEFISNRREDQSTELYAYQERILPATRTLPDWEKVEIVWSSSRETLGQFITLLSEVQKATTELYTNGLQNLEDIISNLGNDYRRLTEIDDFLNSTIYEPSVEFVYWVEVNPANNRLSVKAAPIHIGALVEKHLWHEKRSVILTSATLATHGDFSYLRNTLSADEATELSLGSPFDYENSTLLYIVNDITEPHSNAYQHQLERTLINLCKACKGRTLGLFTSYSQLKRTARAIAGPLAKHNIITFEHGDGASPNALLESFKNTKQAILLGTRSFWEGVDVPGEALSVLVIAKLPFNVPTDPLVAARADTFEDPFNEYHLPEAILRFRQGFGRLIRTQTDRGVVVILDRRVLIKTYGKAFLNSLPHCTVRAGTMDELPGMAAKWLGL